MLVLKDTSIITGPQKILVIAFVSQ